MTSCKSSPADVSDDQGRANFTVLEERVEHHVEDEDGEVLPEARKAMKAAAAEALAGEYLAARRTRRAPDRLRLVARFQ